VRIRNHSSRPHQYTITPHVPAGFLAEPRQAHRTIDPGQEEPVAFRIAVPASTARSIGVFTADVAFDRWDLRHWCEALIEVQP